MVVKPESRTESFPDNRLQHAKTTGSPNNVDIAVYALYLLGGVEKMIHSENIALKCFELAPQSFSWTKFPEYPDTEPARSALMDARKEKNGALVRGNNKRKLWIIPPAGVDWLKNNRARIERELQHAAPPATRQEMSKRLHEILNHRSFKAFQALGEKTEISDADFVDSLKCTLNSSSEDLAEKLMRVRSVATQIQHELVLNYLRFCERRFSYLLASRK